VPDPISVLLDQNIPFEIASWLRKQRPSWTVTHTREAGLQSKPDRDLFNWAQAHGALIITFDEDFADQRSFPVGTHSGVIRLRVWPTTVEETQGALERLLAEVGDQELRGALVIIDPVRIRVRAAR
jgi:predicted nuclease of predicted toxin-antitoxin system